MDLVEPVPKFLEEAKRAAEGRKDGWKALEAGKGKGVRMWCAGLQYFDPRRPGVAVAPLMGVGESGGSDLFATVGEDELVWPNPEQEAEEEDGYDLVMIQYV